MRLSLAPPTARDCSLHRIVPRADTNQDEFYPTVASDGKEFRSGLDSVLNGWGNIYQVDIAALKR